MKQPVLEPITLRKYQDTIKYYDSKLDLAHVKHYKKLISDDELICIEADVVPRRKKALEAYHEYITTGFKTLIKGH